MAQVTKDKEILGDYADQGFTLEESQDDILELYFKDNMIAVFSQLGATQRSIRQTCKRFITRLREPIGVATK